MLKVISCQVEIDKIYKVGETLPDSVSPLFSEWLIKNNYCEIVSERKKVKNEPVQGDNTN